MTQNEKPLDGSVALVTGVDGSIPDARKLHAQLKQNAPDYWSDVVGN